MQRQKEALQKQVDFYQVKCLPTHEQAMHSPSLSPHMTPHGSTSDLLDNATAPSDITSTTNLEISHRRSHSAELIDFDNSHMPSQFVDPRYSASLTEPLNMKEVRARQFGENTSPERFARIGSADRSSSQGSLKRISNNNTVQQNSVHSKLGPSVSSTSVSGKGSSSGSSNRQSVLPMNLAESSKKVSGGSNSSGSKGSGAKTPSQSKKASTVHYF